MIDTVAPVLIKLRAKYVQYPRWAERLEAALDRLERLAEVATPAEFRAALELEQWTALGDPDYVQGEWRSEQLSAFYAVLDTPEDLATAEALAEEIVAALRQPVAVRIATGPAIRAAHQQALIEAQYRGCRVYGMGRR